MLPRLPGKRLLFRLNAAPVHANHANRASAFAVSRIIDPSRLADPQAFVNPDYFASDSTKLDYALDPVTRAPVSRFTWKPSRRLRPTSSNLASAVRFQIAA